MNLLHKFFHHPRLQCFKPIRKEVVAILDVFITIESDSILESLHALVNVV